MPFICDSLWKCLFSLVSHTEVSDRYLFQNLKPRHTCFDLGCHLCISGSALSPFPIVGLHIRLELEVRPSDPLPSCATIPVSLSVFVCPNSHLLTMVLSHPNSPSAMSIFLHGRPAHLLDPVPQTLSHNHQPNTNETGNNEPENGYTDSYHSDRDSGIKDSSSHPGSKKRKTDPSRIAVGHRHRHAKVPWVEYDIV
jgi:hypothetical protein